MRKSFADQLEGLRRVITEPDHEPEPIQTNWTTVPANDNDPEEVEDMNVERRWRMKPSVEEIMRNVKTGDVERNAAGQVVRIGRLQFSDGTQTEAGYKLVMDKPVAVRLTMPAGAMLGTKDAEEGLLGGEEDPAHVAASNAYFANVMDVVPRAYQSGKRRKRGRNFTHAETKEMLAAAYANTDMSKVTFTRYPDGLPAGSPKVAESFLGMQKTTCGESGSVMWQDIATSRAERKEFHDAIDALKDRDRAVFAAAATASSLSDVGVAIGQTKKYAKYNGGGRRALISANDNLMAAINKVAA